jgi:DNA (cytosine-5)-methyltransferase 1
MGSHISAVDLFCGAGGLTHGLIQAGIRVEAGLDIDSQAEHAYRQNNPGVAFICCDIANQDARIIESLFRPGKYRLLAGCAPCQPFSKLTYKSNRHESWNLLDTFGTLVRKILPDLVTMENVPELENRGSEVLQRFLSTLRCCNYQIDRKVVRCQEYGIPQSRTRLVLLASRLGKISVPEGDSIDPSLWKTVRDTIGSLPPLSSGEVDPDDPLHASSALSPLNLERIRATPADGGTWKDWPRELILKCHRRSTGKSYGSIYGRMWWDRPAPTMTTLCNGLGNGRFGHPSQDRAITLREAALFQSFPIEYEFWPREGKLNRKAVGRMIGNAVPPQLARTLGAALLEHAASLTPRNDDEWQQ